MDMLRKAKKELDQGRGGARGVVQGIQMAPIHKATILRYIQICHVFTGYRQFLVCVFGSC